MIFAGIDLAWTYKNETGACLLNDQGEILHLSSAVYTDEAILDLIKPYQQGALYIAVDAPCVVNNETGSRAVENQFKATRINGRCISVYASSRSYLTRTFGAIRGENLRNTLMAGLPELKLGGNPLSNAQIFAETFPTGIVQGIFALCEPRPYKRKKNVRAKEAREGLNALIERFINLEEAGLLKGVKKAFEGYEKEFSAKAHKHYEDMADALLCAFSGYVIYKGWAEPLVIGSVAEGFISVGLLKEGSELAVALHRLKEVSIERVKEGPLKVTHIEAVKSLRYLKSYCIHYETKSGKAAQWELCSRGDLKRLEAEIMSGDSFSDGTVIFATNREKTHVVVLKEYRVSAGRYVYMLPAGLSDPNEDAFVTAKREFFEETGMAFEPVLAEPPRYVSVGIVNEKVTVVYGYYSGTPSKAGQTDEESAEILLIDKATAKHLLKHEEVSVRTAMQLQQFFGLNAFFGS